MNLKILLPMILVFFFSNSSKAQVASTAYNITLKTLLSHSVPEVAVDDIDKQDSSIIYLDAREKNEYKVSHIKGARFVGYDKFSLKSVKDISKDAKIVVYCSVGYRSEKISEKLIKDGFTDVANLYGGIFEWKNRDNEVYKDGEKTEEIHAFNKAWGIWLNKGKKVY